MAKLNIPFLPKVRSLKNGSGKRFAMKPLSEGEEMFALHIRAAGLPPPKREYKFHARRKFLFDFAWPEQKISVEIDGGVFSGGRHTRGKGYESDCIKCALAVQDGWKVYRFSVGQVKKGIAIAFLEEEFKP